MTVRNIYSWVKEATEPQAQKAAKTIADYKREALVKAGRQQFTKLQNLGLNIPVNLA